MGRYLGSCIWRMLQVRVNSLSHIDCPVPTLARSNALTLERVTSEYPKSGSLITFFQPILAHLPPWTPQVHRVHTWAPGLSHSMPSAAQVTPHVIPHSSCTILLCLFAQQSRIWLQYSYACSYYLPYWWSCCEHAYGLVAVPQIVSIGFHYL
jgi:hypothetical protein